MSSQPLVELVEQVEQEMVVRIVLLVVMGVGVGAMAGGAAAVDGGARALVNAHAHNDYEHERPLVDALERGFTSVEADVFLVDGMLLVGHERAELKDDRTLEALYLEPLVARVRANKGRVLPGVDRFFLLVDIKSDAEATYRQLERVLASYAEMLTSVRGREVTPKAVTIVLSGNRPMAAVRDAKQRFVALDGRLTDLESKLPADLMPLVSDDWTKHFQWRGEGAMPAEERAKLRAIVEQAHRAHRLVRFWKTPENEAVWGELRAAEVDLIGTDKLDRLAMFLRK
jgi:hypothetical protein